MQLIEKLNKKLNDTLQYCNKSDICTPGLVETKLNESLKGLYNNYNWPFLTKTIEGFMNSVQLTNDVGTILSVSCGGRTLTKVDNVDTKTNYPHNYTISNGYVYIDTFETNELPIRITYTKKLTSAADFPEDLVEAETTYRLFLHFDIESTEESRQAERLKMYYKTCLVSKVAGKNAH